MGMTLDVNAGQHRHGNGQHHQCGRRVGNPHAQCRGCQHETTQKPSWIPTRRNEHIQCKSLVKPPAFQGNGNEKPSHEQEHVFRTIRASCRSHICHTQQWKQNQGQQRRDPQRHCLRHPPREHPGRRTQDGSHVHWHLKNHGHPPCQHCNDGSTRQGEGSKIHGCKDSKTRTCTLPSWSWTCTAWTLLHRRFFKAIPPASCL